MNTDGESHENHSWISIVLFISATAAKTILTKIAARETHSIEGGGKDDDDEVSLPINDEGIYNIRRSRHRLSFDHSRSHLDHFQKCTKKQFQKSHRHFENKASSGVQSPQPSTQVMPAPHDVQEPDHRNSMKAYDRLQDLMNDNAKALQYQNDHLEVKHRTSSFTERILNRINHSLSSTSTVVSPEDEEEMHEASNCNSDTSRFAEWRSTYNSKIMPNRLIMVRHGQSEGNVNEAIYTEHPDNLISLTNLGWEQAKMAGKALRNQILNNGKEGSTVHFIVSPYVRTMETFHGLAAAWCDPDAEFGHITDEHKRKIMWYNRLAEMGITWHEDPRIREQDFGNYQNQETINKAKRERYKFGVFYYRFPNGESASDVYDRVSTFLDSLWRSFDANRSQNYVLVTHGISVRVLLMRYFRYSIDQFNMLANPKNCEMIILGHDGQGKLQLEGRSEVELKDTICEMLEKDVDNGDEENRIKVNGYKFFRKLRVVPKNHARSRSIRLSNM